jgi:hypothetical protein
MHGEAEVMKINPGLTLSTFVMTNYGYYIDSYIIDGLILQEMKCTTEVLTCFDPNNSIVLNICHNGVFFLHNAYCLDKETSDPTFCNIPQTK